jgi:threonine/homoserine/homoserine lactone efflux protein
LPIIVISLLVLRQFAEAGPVLGLVAAVGALYVLVLGVECFRSGPLVIDPNSAPPASLRKGALINALSPHPYLFWATVGGPYLMRIPQNRVLSAALFVGGFYVCLIGAKMLVALLIGRFRGRMTGRPYRLILRALGLLLFGFAGLLLTDALALMGWLTA